MQNTQPASPQSQDVDDPVDVLIKIVPKHVWVTISAVTVLLLSGWLFFDLPTLPASPDAAAGETLEGRVVELLSTELNGLAEGAAVQRVVVEITSGSLRNQRVEINYGEHMALPEGARVKAGDRVLVERSQGLNGERYAISDFVRLPSLAGLGVVFCVAAIAVGGLVGIRSLISIAVSVLAFTQFIIPGLISGHDPLLVSGMGALLLMIASLYLTYRWTWKTHVALAGLTLSLLVTCVLAALTAGLTHLTGLGSEEAIFLIQAAPIPIDLRGLLLGGIVLGAVGVLDDICVGQASAIFELRRANRDLKWRQLFRHGMVIGRDHIASMINTLLLAYVGASLPLFLLLALQDLSLVQTLNREFLAEEVVRTLIGSLGLISAVPATSLIASMVAERQTVTPDDAVGTSAEIIELEAGAATPSARG